MAGMPQAAEITPVRWRRPGLGLLELSNGPTLAFKDMAMQLLGNLFEYVLEKRGEEINILGATSGDTGSAAEYAMRGKRSVRVFMLSPHERMSGFQRAQMFSLQDANIFNIAVRAACLTMRRTSSRRYRTIMRSRRATKLAPSIRSTGRVFWHRWSITFAAILPGPEQ